MAVRSIFALHYAGPFDALSAFLDWRENGSGTAQENYYVWYVSGVESLDGGVLVDTGARPELLKERKPPTTYNPPDELLHSIGVDPLTIKHVVLSHLHWDHSGGIDRYPNARIYLHRTEFEFWIHDPIARRATFRAMADEESERYLAALAKGPGGKRLLLVDESVELMPGVTIVPAPGHTPGLQAVAVDTARGTAIVASDAAHLFSNFASDTPSAYTYDRVTCVRSYDRLREVAAEGDLVFPGHDPLLATAYPRAANRITKLA